MCIRDSLRKERDRLTTRLFSIHDRRGIQKPGITNQYTPTATVTSMGQRDQVFPVSQAVERTPE